MTNLETRTAIVTGGAQGIGAAISEALLQRKVKVLLADINESLGKEKEEELQNKYGKENAVFMRCDVTSQHDFEAVILAAKKFFGHLDILVNNAGIFDSDWDRMVDINIKSVMRGTLLAFEHLEDKDKKKGGTVVNIASVAGLIDVWPTPAYCATKHAVAAWTRCWGDKKNYNETGVNVCAICPGPVDTNLLGNLQEECKQLKEANFLVDRTNENKLPPTAIGEAVVKILTDGKIGSMLMVTKETGSVYVDFPKEPALLST